MEKWERDLELKDKLSESFNNTIGMSRGYNALVKSIENSIAGQVIIPETTVLSVPADYGIGLPGHSKNGKVVVSRKRTLEAAAAYEGKKIAVLNFASPLRPGGGHPGMSFTQEDCLCRESTLYSCISTKQCMEQFYEPHESLNILYNADMIYTPDVTVFKTYDKIPKIMPKYDWFNVDVITMAAPDIWNFRALVQEDILLSIFETRFTRMMQEALLRNVDVLILGAFGCGEFGNDPAIAATGAARVLERFHKNFDTVEFAIYENKSKKNYHMFRLVLDRYINNQ